MKLYLANSAMTLATMATCVTFLLLSATVVDGAGWNRFLRTPPRPARKNTEVRFVTPTESPTRVPVVSMAPTVSLAPTAAIAPETKSVMIVRPPPSKGITEVEDDMERTSIRSMNYRRAENPRRDGGNRDRNLRDGSTTINFDGNDYDNEFEDDYDNDNDLDDGTFDVIDTYSSPSSRSLQSSFSDDFDLTVNCTFVVASEDETSSASSSEQPSTAPSFEPSQSPSSPSDDSPSASPTNTFSCVTTLKSLPAKGGKERTITQQCLDEQTNYLRWELPMMLTKSLDYPIEFDSSNILNTIINTNIIINANNSTTIIMKPPIDRARLETCQHVAIANDRWNTYEQNNLARRPQRGGSNSAESTSNSTSNSKSDSKSADYDDDGGDGDDDSTPCSSSKACSEGEFCTFEFDELGHCRTCSVFITRTQCLSELFLNSEGSNECVKVCIDDDDDDAFDDDDLKDVFSKWCDKLLDAWINAKNRDDEKFHKYWDECVEVLLDDDYI